jgi:hypothetical protein
MAHCSRSLGETYFRTPRTTVKAFVQLLAVLDQNPNADWQTLVGQTAVEADAGPGSLLVERDEPTGDDDEELASFRL